MKFMLLRLLFLAFLITMNVYSQAPAVESGVPQTLARWRAANYSDVRYKLRLTLEKGAPALKGTITVSLKNKADQIILDWRKTRGKEDLSTIKNVFINGKPVFRRALEPPANAVDFNNSLKFEEINEHLVFKDGVVAGENEIKLDFTSPIATSGAAVTRYVDKQDGAEYVYSLFVPSDASTAFPVFDQPDLKAKFQLHLEVPILWQAISNTNYAVGSAFDLKDKLSKKSFIFTETKPISTYVFAFAAGDFAAVDLVSKTGLPQSIYLRRSQLEKFRPHIDEVSRLNSEAVKYLETYFDYKFPFPKYDLVLIPEFPFGGMEHAGATFLREASVIFPSEPTANDFISRANLIFHEAAHQWFGDTVTMRWFDDLWLKEGFAEFMAYKTLEKLLPEYNAWKAFYERNKPLAYLTDSTRGTTPIYQEIPNLSAAKSAYGNIVYRKAPSFLRQAEFYLGEDKFQTAVRAFLQKYQYKNAEWKDLVNEFNKVHDRRGLPEWAEYWVKQKGVPIIRVELTKGHYEKSEPVRPDGSWSSVSVMVPALGLSLSEPFADSPWSSRIKTLYKYGAETEIQENLVSGNSYTDYLPRLFDKDRNFNRNHPLPDLIFPNYQDYGYGIFLLDEKSRNYVLENIQNEKDVFLRSMMWGALWDSVREAELNPKDYVELAIKNISVETDELTIQTILNRVSTAMNYYLPDAQRDEIAPALENLLIEKIQNAPTLGRRITFYRAFLNIAATENARTILKQILREDFGAGGGNTKMRQGFKNEKSGKRVIAANPAIPLKTKDKFDIVTKLLILGDETAPSLLNELEKAETSDEARRYAYAARAGIATAENKAKFWNDFVNNKEISESWIEAAFVSFNSIRHAELTLPYLEKALTELPNLKRNRKIFFVNGWLAAFIGGQKDEKALAAVNKFLTDNANLDRDLRLKILENVDALERAVRIRAKYGK